MNIFVKPEVRAAIYALGLAVFGVLTVIGVLNDRMVESLTALLSAGIALMAVLNTPTRRRVARREAKDVVSQ